MKKLGLILLTLVIILIMAGAVQAGMLIPSSEKTKENAKAPEKSPVITKTAGGEWELDRVDFIHYAKPGNTGKPAKPPKTPSCFKLMGVKWNNLPVSYVINPTNNDGLSTSFVTSAISSSAETWDNVTSSELFNDTYGVDNTAQYGVQNYSNAIVFGSFSNNDIIGVTTVWYTHKGRQIVEFDMKLNDYYQWGDATASGTPDVMDLTNIATHELGHSVGMDDIYSDTCTEVTMYGYSDNGETKKKTLESADIQGLRQMYGM